MSEESEAARRLFSGPCDFVFGATDALPPGDLPEVAFVGRSNVGKSSLINALTNRKSLARVSQTPGRTRQINFFRLGGALMLVDLPGYGFAQASKALAEQWQQAIFAYLNGRQALRRVILLIDSRRGLMPIDGQAMTLLDRAAVSYVVALTKTDTLKPAERAATQKKVESALALHPAAYPAIFGASALTGEGLEDLRLHIAALAAC